MIMLIELWSSLLMGLDEYLVRLRSLSLSLVSGDLTKLLLYIIFE